MAYKTETILSAGIDIGTSTTKIIISRLTLENTAGSTHVPKIEIVDKEILYKSPIYRTPLVDDQTIDMPAIEKIVFHEYAQANIQPSEIATGAILITGETATKKNASELIHHLSDAAGDFLVATAGPDLESILAARGSGAAEYSKKTSKVVANIDIGGGTTNIAVLKHGEVIGTVTLHLGGRLLEYRDGYVVSIAPSIQRLLQTQYTLKIGDARNEAIEQVILAAMLKSLNHVLRHEQQQENIPLLLGHLPNWQQSIDCILFSGGVAQCIFSTADANCQTQQFEDMGILIAEAIRDDVSLQQFEWLTPKETIRATVTGAGTQSTDVSGSTIEIDSHQLPLKNIPVWTCDLSQTGTFQHVIFEALEQANQLYRTEQEMGYALYLKNVPYLKFQYIEEIAAAIVDKWPENEIILIVVEADYAKVLGQAIKARTQVDLICIDQLHVNTGDYIDVGKPVQAGVVPVVVKTLAFHKA